MIPSHSAQSCFLALSLSQNWNVSEQFLQPSFHKSCQHVIVVERYYSEKSHHFHDINQTVPSDSYYSVQFPLPILENHYIFDIWFLVRFILRHMLQSDILQTQNILVKSKLNLRDCTSALFLNSNSTCTMSPSVHLCAVFSFSVRKFQSHNIQQLVSLCRLLQLSFPFHCRLIWPSSVQNQQN